MSKSYYNNFEDDETKTIMLSIKPLSKEKEKELVIYFSEAGERQKLFLKKNFVENWNKSTLDMCLEAAAHDLFTLEWRKNVE